MRWNLVGPFIRNFPFGTETAFRKGLKSIGEEVTVIDPDYPDQKFDEEADVNMIVKWLDPGIYREKFKSLPGKKIVYQVDDLRFPHIKKMMVEMREFCDHALTFDDDGARLALEYGYKSTKKMLLTADDVLYRRIPGMQKDIDVSFVGSLSNGSNHRSRMRMLELVKGIPGIKLVVANELFDIGKICEIYNRSKIVLNHATDVGQPFGHGFGYQCRHFEAGFSGAFVLSNIIDNDDTLKNICMFSGEHEIINIKELLKDDMNEWRQKTADGLYAELKLSHRPENRAAEMVDFVRSIS